MLVTTIPVTKGVMTFFNLGINGLNAICKHDPTMHNPKVKPSNSVEFPPAFFTDSPTLTITPTKVKLVPCKHNILAPIPNGWMARINVPMPEANRDMLTGMGSQRLS